ncbi:MAG: hypothetical protein KDD82_28255 [Planctomycetes bacterium]|nr:hypothetical protein [Planctomycetota bacterium]
MSRSLIPTCALLACALAAEATAQTWDEQFANLDAWRPLRVHDTQADRIEAEDGALVLALDTLGTDDATVKLRGVEARRELTIPKAGAPLVVQVELDWNGQENGSYLTLGLALVPPRPANQPPQRPHDAQTALAFEFVGVPPGKNARPFLWWRTAGGLRPLYTEGWPQPKREDRVGRPVARTRITLEVTGEAVRLLENDRELYKGPGTFSGPCRLQLFATGHSNYPLRTLKVHRVQVDAPAGGDE